MNTTNMAQSIGLLIARIGFGGYMMTHGWGKVQMLLARNFEDFGDPIGLGKPLSLTMAASAEFLCALLVIVGLATRLATIPLIITMGIAAFVVHRSDPWTMGSGASKEPAMLFLIGFLTLLLAGPGKLSLDAVIWPKLRRRRERARAAAGE